MLAVLVGGFVGTGLRLLVDLALPNAADGLPLGTLLVNVVGAFVLGLLVARVWPHAAAWLRAGLGAGLLGSFTTFSAIAVSLVAQAHAGAWWLAAGYLVLSLVLGFGAAALGLWLGRPRRAFRERGPGVSPIDWVDE
ncbi:MAG TPA: CrcB family protein [Terrimesophilobacter sp.]|nr:CrcB family protein [Terrimesophilobacter sp.]